MNVIFIVGIILLFIIVILFGVVYMKRKSFGTLSGVSVYNDTSTLPGEVLYSEALSLKGKPDYIIKKGNEYIPVEVKTGRTPTIPYRNHVAQLFAYCALIEEKYSVRPKYGVVRYPEKEFEVVYTVEGENGLKKVIQEMKDMKLSGVEPQCKHHEHNI
jgi:CRISPR-associated exonuclease Cas4